MLKFRSVPLVKMNSSHTPGRSGAIQGDLQPKSKESDLELKLNELVVELGRSLQKIAQPIQSSMNRTLMSV